MAEPALRSEHENRIRDWERNAPWLRRMSMRFGLQRKLIVCFIALLTAAMGVTCFVFNQEMNERLGDLTGEQANQVATALSLTSQAAISGNDWNQLDHRAQELLAKSRNIIYVAYLDPAERPKVYATRDVQYALSDLMFGQESLMRVHRRTSPTFGEYVEVVAPILSTPAPDAKEHYDGPHLLGYVAVGISQMHEQSQIKSVQYVLLGIACVMVLIGFPVVSLLVHRIFLPIRMLVTVTKQFTAGNLDARAEIHRPDAIGDLARSFDEMAISLKHHQEALAQANEKLAEANRDLEKKVEQRTGQLETANQRLSDEILEKEAFLRAVSHDLNAPLRNIGGMASMLLTKHRDQMDEEMIHRLNRIKSNVDLESGLIAELLELSRIKTRRQKMEPVHVAIMIKELSDLFEPDLRSKSISLIVDTSLPVLHAERTRIRQVFQNLIDNAIKYMGTGETREIHIGCQMHRSEAEFYVRDTGVGIEPTDAEKIFFIFRRGKNPATQTIAGKGVGLATVKSIVETYNGKIWVSGAVGSGSTFRFTINGKYLAPASDNVGPAERAA